MGRQERTFRMAGNESAVLLEELKRMEGNKATGSDYLTAGANAHSDHSYYLATSH